MDLTEVIAEMRELKQCLLTGFYTRAWELAQNVDDTLTTFEIQKSKEMREAQYSERSNVC